MRTALAGFGPNFAMLRGALPSLIPMSHCCFPTFTRPHSLGGDDSRMLKPSARRMLALGSPNQYSAHQALDRHVFRFAVILQQKEAEAPAVSRSLSSRTAAHRKGATDSSFVFFLRMCHFFKGKLLISLNQVGKKY